MDRHQSRSGSGLSYVADPDGRARTFAHKWRRMHSVAGLGLGSVVVTLVWAMTHRPGQVKLRETTPMPWAFGTTCGERR